MCVCVVTVLHLYVRPDDDNTVFVWMLCDIQKCLHLSYVILQHCADTCSLQKESISMDPQSNQWETFVSLG